MSKHFWLAIALICSTFAVYELWLNFHLRSINDAVAQACLKPAKYSIKWEWYIPNGT